MTRKIAILSIILMTALGCESFIDSVTNTASALSEGLVAYYPFNGDTQDASGNGNHATNNGAISTTDRFNKVASAYDFNSSYMIIPVSDLGNTFTISTWVYYRTAEDSFIGNAYISKIVSASSIDNAELLFLVKKIKGPEYIIKSAFGITGEDLNYSAADKINLNVWYNVIVTYDGTIIKIYSNSALSGLGFLSLQNWASVGANITLGAIRYSGLPIYMDGKIDDVRIYNRALSAEEVKALYDSEKQ